ncbi:hypothetical protein ACFVZC_37405 [Streptomyces marokkonensis]|uniref:Uncharacterized protein n=1 Tax=Streptomyces marokkonensis TaxID=324855 RepID=A0ABW6QJS4_9ACTN
MAPFELAELLLGASQADLETLDVAKPAFRLGFGDSGDQVVADLGKRCPLGRVRSEERASDTSVLVDTGESEGTPLEGPPLGEEPQARRFSPARMRARRLLDTASGELMRLIVQAFATGAYVRAAHWIERR